METGYSRGMRTAAFVSLLLLVPASSALASDGPRTLTVSPSAPSAVFVDGVKVGAESIRLPKQQGVRAGRCSGSGCTLVITY